MMVTQKKCLHSKQCPNPSITLQKVIMVISIKYKSITVSQGTKHKLNKHLKDLKN